MSVSLWNFNVSDNKEEYLSTYHVARTFDHLIFILFKKYFIYLFIFRESGREGEREGEKHQCVVASRMAPMGDLACNPGMSPDWE